MSPGRIPASCSRRVRQYAGDFRQRIVFLRRVLGHDSEKTAFQVVPLAEAREDGIDVLQRYCEADSGVIPLDPRGLVLSTGRCGHEHSQDPPGNIDERSAVVHRRHLGVRLYRLSPNPAEGTDDADADRRRPFGARPRATESSRRLPDVNLALGAGNRDTQPAGVDLEKREHAGLVRGDDSRHVAILLARQRDEDGGRLIGEIERAGNDVTVGRDDQTGRRAHAFADPLAPAPQNVGAAGGLNLDDTGSNASDRGLHCLALKRCQVFIRRSCREDEERQRRRTPPRRSGSIRSIGIASVRFLYDDILRPTNPKRQRGIQDHGR